MDMLGLDDAIAEGIVRDAADRLGRPNGRVRLVRVERQRWPSTALGCPEPGMAYAQVVIDGWRVLVAVDGRTLDYRVDAKGRFRRCGDAPPEHGAAGGGWLDPTR